MKLNLSHLKKYGLPLIYDPESKDGGGLSVVYTKKTYCICRRRHDEYYEMRDRRKCREWVKEHREIRCAPTCVRKNKLGLTDSLA